MITKTTTTTTEASADDRQRVKFIRDNNGGVEDRRQARCIVNDNGVFIFLAISSLTVTMSRLCLVAVLF